jgi:hypothetical protein
MSEFYFEPDELKNLPNKELIKKQKEITEMFSKAQRKSTPASTMEQIIILMDLYTAELDRRMEEDLIDEDEMDDIYDWLDEND